MKLDEETIEGCLNVDSDSSVVLQLTNSEIVHMVLHPDKGVDIDDETEEGTNEEHTSIDKCIGLTEGLTKGLEQKSFISEQHIVWVYKIQEVLQKK
jgi:hypothetical protein